MHFLFGGIVVYLAAYLLLEVYLKLKIVEVIHDFVDHFCSSYTRFYGLSLLLAVAMYILGAITLGPFMGISEAVRDVAWSCLALFCLMIGASLFGAVHDSKAETSSYVTGRRRHTRASFGVITFAAMFGFLGMFVLCYYV